VTYFLSSGFGAFAIFAREAGMLRAVSAGLDVAGVSAWTVAFGIGDEREAARGPRLGI